MTAVLHSRSAVLLLAERTSRIVRALFRDPILGVCVLFLLVVAACALFPSAIAPTNPNNQNLYHRFVRPLSPTGGISILGSDALGRDMLSRIVYGSRVSIGIATAAVTLAGGVGIAAGVLAGLREGFIGAFVMRLADVQFSIPNLVLALVLVAIVGPGILNVVVVLAVGGWVPYARVTRAQVLVVKQREFVDAARGLGASDLRLVRRHILPNAIGVVAIIAALEMGQMMITEASLSFLGLGVPAGTADWGAMISDGRDYLASAWWASAFPGLAILFTVVSLNVIGDWLSDRSNPALRDW